MFMEWERQAVILVGLLLAAEVTDPEGVAERN